MACACVLAAGVTDAAAQELEPGAYQNAPIGVNVAIASYGYSTGNVLVDATLPVEGANARVHTLVLGYLRTFRLFGLSSKVDAGVGASHAHFEGFVDGEFRTRVPSGLNDPRVRLLVNLLGAPPLAPTDYVRYRQHTILGASVQVALPLGQYDPERLINLGANRWAFRPELGFSHARNRWTFEAAAGSWFFTKNEEHFGGTTLRQRPLYYAKGNVIYTFRRSLWVSASYGIANGGETLIDDVLRNDLQRNNRIGATLSLPIEGGSSLKFSYTGGLMTLRGADFDTFTVGYQYTWR
jgi:outer membrane putative beta-barrel porin/alpha-amylase